MSDRKITQDFINALCATFNNVVDVIDTDGVTSSICTKNIETFKSLDVEQFDALQTIQTFDLTRTYRLCTLPLISLGDAPDTSSEERLACLRSVFAIMFDACARESNGKFRFKGRSVVDELEKLNARWLSQTNPISNSCPESVHLLEQIYVEAMIHIHGDEPVKLLNEIAKAYAIHSQDVISFGMTVPIVFHQKNYLFDRHEYTYEEVCEALNDSLTADMEYPSNERLLAGRNAMIMNMLVQYNIAYNARRIGNPTPTNLARSYSRTVQKCLTSEAVDRMQRERDIYKIFETFQNL